MSSSYRGYVKGTNPLYYWPMEHSARELYVSTTNLGDTYAKFFPDGSGSSYGYFYTPESSQLLSNNTASGFTGSRGVAWGYWTNLAIDLDDESPRPQGPIFGGGGACLRHSVGGSVSNVQLLQTGWSSLDTAKVHEVGIGRNTDCTWTIWVKTFEDCAAATTRHYLTSGPTSGSALQQLMFGEKRESDGTQKVKVKTKQGSTNQSIDKAHTWDAKLWNMWTITMPETDLDQTITDGIGVFRNGKKILTFDAVGNSMPKGGTLLEGDGPTYAWPLGAISTAPARTEGMYCHIANWKRILSDSEISSLYYHATSPSPSRVRGGLYGKLGRMI